MKKAQSITHIKSWYGSARSVLLAWFIFTAFTILTVSSACTQQETVLYLTSVCCAFFLFHWNPFSFTRSLACLVALLPPIVVFYFIIIITVIFSILPYLFPLILYVPVFSTHILLFLEIKCASAFELLYCSHPIFLIVCWYSRSLLSRFFSIS